jgi:hypothetical protein
MLTIIHILWTLLVRFAAAHRHVIAPSSSHLRPISYLATEKAFFEVASHFLALRPFELARESPLERKCEHITSIGLACVLG